MTHLFFSSMERDVLRRHHTWSSMSPPMIDVHPLFDQQQHPVCSMRQTVCLIIVIAAPPSLSLFLAPMLEPYPPPKG